jgi:hypothetical protein
MKTKVVKVTATSFTSLKGYVLVPEDATEEELYNSLILDDCKSVTIAEHMTPDAFGDWAWEDIYDADPLITPDIDFVEEILEEREEDDS